MKKQATFHRLLTYMWRYKWVSILALAFIFTTTLVMTALPLLARYFIDHFISRRQIMTGFYILILYYALFLLRVLFTFLGQYSFARVAYSMFAICVRRVLKILSGYVWLILIKRLQERLSPV